MRQEIPAVLNDALGFNIDRVAKLFRRELTLALADYDLTPEQWQIMSVIWNGGKALNQKNITQLTLKDKHNVSRLIKRLVAKGWLEKHSDPNDARVFLVTATTKGQAQREAVTHQLYAHFENLKIGLSEQDRAQLLNFLKMIRLHLGDDEKLEGRSS
ncbi:MAG: MarR family winged helix-turn-helix transcriptional regulator [Chloroflexota bacterium]